MGEPTSPAANHPEPAAATAQDVFKRVMRYHIAPALGELGFRGTSQSFRYKSGDYTGSLQTQRSVNSTKNRVLFTVHLSARHDPTRSVYWTRSLLGLVPGRREIWWTVTADDLAEPIAAKFLAVFHSYGWPAILAALDDPGFPPGPAVRWARTFPPAIQHGATREELGPLAWVLQPVGRDHDGLFAKLADDDHIIRFTSVQLISDLATGDPRAAPALINRLERDPSEAVRSMAARGLRPQARQDSVRQALVAAAADDESLEVRWEARYALRLTASPTS